MKMSLFDKFLLALALLVLLALALFAGCVALSVVPMASVSDYLVGLTAMWDANAYLIGGAALLLFLITVRLFVASYSGDRSQAYTRLAVTETGEIAISIQTIKQIAAAFIALNPEVVASASVVVPMKDGLCIRVKVCVKDGVLLPDVSRSIQKDLKAHLETITGLTVKEIGVLLDNNRSNYTGKGR